MKRVRGAPAPRVRVYTPEASWLAMHVLADAGARRATFGADLPLDLPFPIAANASRCAQTRRAV